jgi:hypothetical protein
MLKLFEPNDKCHYQYRASEDCIGAARDTVTVLKERVLVQNKSNLILKMILYSTQTLQLFTVIYS